MTDHSLLARTFVEIADTPTLEFDIDAPLILLSQRSVEVLGISSSGVMLMSEGALTLGAWSDSMARTLALFELRYHEGPNLDCCQAGHALLNRNLAPAETPWPRWGAAGLAAGYQTVHALPLCRRGEVMGSVVFYQVDSNPIDEFNVTIGQALADATAIAIFRQRAAFDAATLTDQLYRALSSRVVVEQAKGIIAARFGMTVEAAFDQIRQHARNNNERLDALARRIIDGPPGVLTLRSEQRSIAVSRPRMVPGTRRRPAGN